MRTNIDGALMSACANNDTAVVKLLLEYGANAKGSIYCAPEEPLRAAMENKNKEMIKLLRKYGASKTKAVISDGADRLVCRLLKNRIEK